MPSDIQSILQLEVPIIVRIAQRPIAMQDVTNWVPGAIVELGKEVGEELEVLVNDVEIGQGVAVKVGENFGIRLTFVGDLKAKIAAMSSHQPMIAQEEEESDVTDMDAARIAEEMLLGQL